MTYRTIEPGLAELLSIGLDTQLPKKVELWKQHLANGRATQEMRDVFVGIGWLSSARDSRLGDVVEEEEPKIEIPAGSPNEDVDLREPKVKGKPDERPAPDPKRHGEPVSSVAGMG